MSTNREGYYVGEKERECTKCGTIFPKTSGMTICPECNVKRVKEQKPEQRMYRRAKSRAKIKGLEFSIEVSDIDIPQFCPILGIELKVHKGKPGHYDDSPSLDRFNNDEGYIKENVWVVSAKANKMKSSASPEELVEFAKWIMETYE